jgi:hypothetical protein
MDLLRSIALSCAVLPIFAGISNFLPQGKRAAILHRTREGVKKREVAMQDRRVTRGAAL